ncbi:MAG: hypothetical protein IJ347_07620, partial [Faecalibacterium sp.]|nr:hypothetical protein [Faecalibacterium sp.]
LDPWESRRVAVPKISFARSLCFEILTAAPAIRSLYLPQAALAYAAGRRRSRNQQPVGTNHNTA